MVQSSAVSSYLRLAAVFTVGCVALPACRPDLADSGSVAQALPADTERVVSVDIASVLAWEPVKRSRARLLGPVADAWVEAAAACDVGLATGRVTVGWSPELVTVVVAAHDVGRDAALRCLSEQDGLDALGVTVALEQSPPVIEVAGEQWAARATADDTLVVQRTLGEGVELPALDALGLPSDSSMANALAGVDARSPVWAVVADGASSSWDAAFADGPVVLTMGLDADALDIKIDGAARDSDEATSVPAVRELVDEALASVYLPSSIAGRADVEADDGRVAVSLEISTAEVYALDLRWLGASSPAPVASEPLPADAAALLETWSSEKSSALLTADADLKSPPSLLLGEFEPVGVAACDDYIRMFGECIDDKFPEARESMRQALGMSAEAWRKAAALGSDDKSLDQACTAAQEAVRSTCA